MISGGNSSSGLGATSHHHHDMMVTGPGTAGSAGDELMSLLEIIHRKAVKLRSQASQVMRILVIRRGFVIDNHNPHISD